MVAVPVLLTLVYSGFLLYCIFGALRLYRKGTQLSAEFPSLSVVVPVRNEAGMLVKTLEALSRQNYSGEWEVICVDDRSTDGSGELLEDFCRQHAHFRCVHVPVNSVAVPSPKKRALMVGFKEAKGEILMTTDADCVPPPHWLQSMASNFTPSVGIVQGPKKITGPDNLLTRYQKLEVFGFVSIEASTFSMGKPLLASAPSLAYRKDLFEAAKGFEGMEHLESGDDDMLVHRMVNLPGGKVRYNLDMDSFVATPAVSSWRTLLTQRARWSSNGTRYQDKKYVTLLAGLFAFYLWLFIAPLPVLWGWMPLSYGLIPFAVKCLLDFTFLTQTGVKFKQEHLLRDFWWVQILNIPIVVASVILGQLGLYRWK